MFRKIVSEVLHNVEEDVRRRAACVRLLYLKHLCVVAVEPFVPRQHLTYVMALMETAAVMCYSKQVVQSFLFGPVRGVSSILAHVELLLRELQGCI